MSNFASYAFSGQLERKAAVAGSFYPSDPTELRREVEQFLSTTQVITNEKPRLLICPHAGYIFSGAIAAKGIAHLSSTVRRVILIGPSHYQAFPGFAYPEVSSYETPLGKVIIDREIVDKLSAHPRARPASGADEKEHCLEVQLPLLQVKLKEFTIVPLLTGKIDPPVLAEALLPFIDESTVIIASSDLSHYHTQQDARKRDDRSIASIINGTLNGEIDGCGEIPIRTIMHCAKKLNLKPIVIDAKTSYETAPRHCSSDRVVGYASIAYVPLSEEQVVQLPAAKPGVFSDEHQRWMLKLARESLTAAVHGKRASVPGNIPSILNESRGCFVTLTKHQNLRGCIGYIEPIKPLYLAIIENARNAALYDHRFSQVTINELGLIDLEISVLTKPVPLKYKNSEDLLNKLQTGIDGVILTSGHHQSTFLPQVWEQLPQKIDFLEHLSLKAGMLRDGWKTAEVKIYRVEHFEEK